MLQIRSGFGIGYDNQEYWIKYPKFNWTLKEPFNILRCATIFEHDALWDKDDQETSDDEENSDKYSDE